VHEHKVAAEDRVFNQPSPAQLATGRLLRRRGASTGFRLFQSYRDAVLRICTSEVMRREHRDAIAPIDASRRHRGASGMPSACAAVISRLS
jgi:hypothetical protein